MDVKETKLFMGHFNLYFLRNVYLLTARYILITVTDKKEFYTKINVIIFKAKYNTAEKTLVNIDTVLLKH